MYYLEQKQFKPAMILFGIPFIPCIVGLIIANIILFKIELFILLLVIIFIYVIAVMSFWKLSRRQNHYICVKESNIELEFCDFVNGETKLELQFNQITKFEYYKITSIRSWLMLFSYVFPKCVYITYILNGEEQTKFIGYLDAKDIREISNKINTELKIY